MKELRVQFSKYYHQYKDKIFTYYYYRVNFNRALAEDLSSEVFIKALKNFQRYDKNQSFQSWIFTIARNHLINYYRLEKREVSLEVAYNYCDSPWEKIYDNLECKEVMKAITKLKTYHKDVLLMRWVDGLTNQEIALVLDKDEGAVRTQLSRALQALKDICQKYG